MNKNTTKSLPLGIDNSRRNIFAGVLLGGIDKKNSANTDLINSKVNVAKMCRPKFFSSFPFNVFHDSYAIFYEMLVTLQLNSFTLDQLEAVIDNNRDLVLDSPYINVELYSKTADGNIASNDDIVDAVTMSAKELLTELSYTSVSEDEFLSSVRIYLDWYKNDLAEVTALNMSSIMNDAGLDYQLPNKRKRHYQGIEDMQEFYNDNMRIINALSDERMIRSRIVNEQWLINKIQDAERTDKNALMTTGITNIDKAIKGLRRGNMLGVMGPPKGGKTRFTNYLIQRALNQGLNVCVWSLEGTTEEWESMQTACFLAQASYKKLVNEGSRSDLKVNNGNPEDVNKDQLIRISSEDILHKTYGRDVNTKTLILKAQTVMATSESYGRLSFIEGTAYLEDFLDVIEAHWNSENQFDVLVIDQLIDIMSRKGKGKVERISEAYVTLKNFIANVLKIPALAIIPCQLKPVVVDMLRAHPEETIDVTAGAESAETVRAPDDVIGLFSDKNERNNNQMKIYSVASRHSGNFDDFVARCYLECCFFTDAPDKGN